MSHQVTTRSGRTGKVTARALRFGLHPTGAAERGAEVLALLADGDPNVLEVARHRIADPSAGQLRIDNQVDRVRRHAIEVLDIAESRLRSKQAA